MIVNNRIVYVALILILITVVGSISGCASPATTKAMVTDSITAMHRHPYTISIRIQGGSETGIMDTSNISNEDFEKAVEESVIKSGLFSKVTNGKDSDYMLGVTIVSISKPLAGASFTVSMEAAWTLVNAVSQDVLMRESIKSSHTATMGQALVAVTRLRLAVEGAAQENIRLGLLAISNLKL